MIYYRNHLEFKRDLFKPLWYFNNYILGVNRLKGSSIKGYQKISSQNSLGRTTVKPVSSSLANAVMPKTKNYINGTAQIDKRRSSEPIELNGKNNHLFS